MNCKILIVTVLSVLSVLSAACGGSGCDDPSPAAMREAFRSVPSRTPVAVYWYWISDNISEEGAIRDLEAMKQAGITRAFIGNIGIDDLPRGEHKLFTPEWWRVMHAALKRAGELDIEIGIFNSPGWSQSGGPWVEPEQSMRYLASERIDVEGPLLFDGPLPDAGDRAQDVRVVAYPLPADVQSDTRRAEKRDGEELRLDLKVSGEQPMRSLTIRVDRPVLTQAALYCLDGGEYRLVRQFTVDRSNLQTNVGFDPLAPVVVALAEPLASDYRLVIPAPGSVAIEATISSLPQVEAYPEKTLAKMFQTPLPMWHDYLWERQPAVTQPEMTVRPEQVVDLTDRFRGGRLRWEVPAGKWRIERLAMRTTTVTNSPASAEGVGLETDKMSRRHIASHFDAFIGEILRRIPAEDRRTFRVVVQDSYETGGQNWTDDMARNFEQAYGYDPVPYLPVLHGTVVGSPEISDRFLWDLRRLVADRVAYDYVGGLRDQCRRHGLTTWLENYGHWGFPGEFLQYGGQSDEVAGEFWSEGSLGDIENRAASSCAHIYGKRRVWAESFTAGMNAFARYPYQMKQRGDRFFTEGINASLLHVYIMQPYEDRLPGMNAWFGNEFNRKNTWFEQLDLFVDYLKRTNYLLQQGRYVADAAYFIGEDVPKMTGVCDPALPAGYSFDYVNAEVLMHHARVKNGRLVLDSGMDYGVLVLPGLETMRPELLDRLRELVRDGLVLLGPSPERSPSLAGYPEADGRVRRLAEGMWPSGGESNAFGRGRVFRDGVSLEAIFDRLGLEPDCRIEGDGCDVRFIHRTAGQCDIYFLSNQQERKVAFDATFRVDEGDPQLWDALSGRTRRLPRFSRQQGLTRIPLELEPLGSAFVVFDRSAKAEPVVGENFPEPSVLTRIEGPWEVSFRGLEAPEEPVRFESLSDWTTSDDARIRYFSGAARYSTRFSLAAGEAEQGTLCVDLGRVMVMARVYVNGVSAGGVWTPPYRVEITDLVREGENTLEVEVVNNWMNRLIGDLRLPPDERKTWTPVNPWNADSPLQASGLLGPVVIQRIDYADGR